jgi:hypothetical protein
MSELSKVERLRREMGIPKGRKEGLDEQITALKSQLRGARAHAAATGEYADAVWYRRTEDECEARSLELRRVNRLIDDIERDLGQVRRTAHREAEGENGEQHTHFVQVARVLLEPSLYLAIWAEVRRQRQLLHQEHVNPSITS